MQSAIACLGAWGFLVWLFGIYPARRKANAAVAAQSPSDPIPVWLVQRENGRMIVRIPGSQLDGGYDLHALNRGEYATTAKQLAQLDHFDPAEWIDHKDAPPLRKQRGA